jgi:hypothetical protein
MMAKSEVMIGQYSYQTSIAAPWCLPERDNAPAHPTHQHAAVTAWDGSGRVQVDRLLLRPWGRMSFQQRVELSHTRGIQ